MFEQLWASSCFVITAQTQLTAGHFSSHGAIVEMVVGKTFHFLKQTLCESSETLRPKGRVWLGLLSNWILDFKLKTAL